MEANVTPLHAAGHSKQVCSEQNPPVLSSFIWIISMPSTLREAVPKTDHLSHGEFAALRLRLLTLGASVIETVSLIRLAFAAYPEVSLALTLQPAAP